MNLENLWKLLRLGDLKNVWKKEWTVIAVAVASLVLLLIIVAAVRKSIVRARRRKRRKRLESLGYNPKAVSSRAVASAYSSLMLGILLAVKFFDSEDDVI